MLINNFFNLQLYVLGAGWLINSSLQNNSEKWCYFKKKDLILLYLTKSIVQIKKNLFLIQTIKKYKGTFFFINSYFYYFKNIHFFCFNIRENLLQVYFKGYFSNYLCYKKKKNDTWSFILFQHNKSLCNAKRTKTIRFTSNRFNWKFKLQLFSRVPNKYK